MKKEKQKNLLQRYPLSCVLIVVIWVLCLTPWIPESPLNNVRLIDKWTHLVMYGTLTATNDFFIHRRIINYSSLFTISIDHFIHIRI